MINSGDQPAVVVKDLYKSFKLPHEQHSGIKQLLINKLKGNKGFEVQHVLKNVSFEIKKGEFFGIVGRNGSGKSTLLKLLAGIYIPNSGTVQINGSLTPFIELGVGFNPELTGRENIFLNGALLGFSRFEMEAMYDNIVEFAELDKFMDQKLKNYSSGMQVRLAFSIAIRAKSDILILDEVLAVGDEAFQRKCTQYFMDVKKSGQTVVLVTHDMNSVERFCDRALVVESGKMLGIYDPHKARTVYNKINSITQKTAKSSSLDMKRWGSGKVKLSDIQINNKTSNIARIKRGDELVIRLIFDKKPKGNIIVGIGFYDEAGVYISGPNSIGYKLPASKTVSYKVGRLPFNPGDYMLEIAIFDEAMIEEYDHIVNVKSIRVENEGPGIVYGKIELYGEWIND